MPTEIARFEEKMSEDATILTLQGNTGFISFDTDQIVLFRSKKHEKGFTLKTAPRSRVELCRITETEPNSDKYNGSEDVEDVSVDLVTEITFFLRNKSFREQVQEDSEDISELWLDTL
jgi:hypothetical protein